MCAKSEVMLLLLYCTIFFLLLQTLAVDKWNTDSVEEFLSIYLVKDGDEISEETEEVLAQP